MQPRIQDFRFADYVRAAGLAHCVQARAFSGGAKLGALYLDTAWLDTRNWFPITNDAATLYHFFGVFARAKIDYLYAPQTFAALAARAQELSREPDYARALALGGGANYWHFVMDFAPRLVFTLEGGDPATPLLVGPDFGPQQQGVLDHVFAARGLKTPRVIVLPEGIAPVRRALFPSVLPRAVAVELWDRFLPHTPRKAERLIFARRGNVRQRKLLNEDEIIALAQRRGFEIIDPGAMSFAEQVETFRDAKVVMGAHGAALTNVAFAPKGGALVEFIAGIEQPFFQQLAEAKQWRRIAIRDESVAASEAHHHDMRIDPKRVERTLDELGL